MIEGLMETLAAFGIVPSDPSLYEEAFTHASYTNEHKECPNYDRLEFLGDSILDMVVGDMVFEEFPEYNSGKLSKARAALVEGRMLTYFSEERFGFSKLVRYSNGEKDNDRFHKHIDEDVFEAFIGAVYLDKGYYFVKDLLSVIYQDLIHNAGELNIKGESKSNLMAKMNGAIIDYVVTSQRNLNSEDVSYTVEARLDGVVLGKGEGHNIREAEINAAADALSKESR